ncbi:MAG: hypothetical protein MUF73_04420 [Rhodobacteraceae bacterium]|nr:hypothetical protein [Paracoccaceae bacterium]
MRPDLALSLSFDGIGLTRRTAEGWVAVGHVALDAPDLSDRLQDLRDAAGMLSPDGIATAIVLPDDQILNRHLPDVPASPDAVAAALDGLTPYAVADLVFDWQPHPDGGVVVAAVARETIDEALAFARQHGFNPVALTARPAAGLPFADEPDFWSAAAPADAVDQIAPAPGTAPDGPDAAPVGDDQDHAAEDHDADGRDDTAAAAQPPDGNGFATRRARPSDTVRSVAEGTDDPVPDAPFLLAASAQTVAGQSPAGPADGAGPAPAARIAALPTRLRLQDAVEVPPERAEPEQAVDIPLSPPPPGAEAGTDERAVVEPPSPPSAGDAAPVAPPRLGTAGRKTAAPGSRLATGRPTGATNRRGGAGKSGLAGATLRGGKPGGIAAPLRADGSVSRLAETSPAARAAGASLTVRPLGDPALTAGARLSLPVPVILGLVAALLIALVAAVVLSRVVVGWLAPPTDVAAISPDAPMVAVVPLPDPDRTATVPAADLPTSEPVTAAAVPVPPVAAPPAGTPAVDTGPAGPDVVERQPAATADPARDAASTDPADLAEGGTGTAPPRVDSGAAGDVARLAADPVAPAQVAAPARLAAPGGGDAPPAIPAQFVPGPGPAPVADPDRPVPVSAPPQALIVRAAVDRAASLQDPLSLVSPGPGPGIDLPDVQPVPPPGVTYRLDARGLVEATPDGAVSPDGHRVTLGAPPIVPPVRPLTATPAPAIAADTAEVQRLARLRPPPRPASVPATAPVTEGAAERAPAPGATAADTGAPGAGAADITAALTAAQSAARSPDATTIRPAPRPSRPDAGTAAGTAAPEAALFATATPQAVSASLRPVSRPAGLDAIAAAASVRIAPLPPPEPAATARAPAAAPDAAPQSDFDYDDGEPETASAAPRIPSSASVSRQATVENALNLRELNLIGVYGTSSDRRALVRLPNGRFVRVEVGDRMDGGQVADIGDRDLRYIKGGRSIVLSMPRG